MLTDLLQPAWPIGIDLGSTGAKLLQLGRDRQGLETVASARVEEPLDDSAGVTDALLRAIGMRIDAGGFRGRRCAVAIPDQWVRLRSTRQPNMPLADVAKAAEVEGASRLGFTEAEPGVIGWVCASEVHAGDAGGSELVLFGADEQRLEGLATGLASVGIETVSIEPGFVAMVRAMTRRLRRASDAHIARLIVNVGAGSSMVILTRGCEVIFAKPLEIGGNDMTAAVAKRLDLDPSTAAQLRRQRMQLAAGREAPDIDKRIDRAIFDAARPVLTELAHEISLCHRHCSVSFRGLRPERCQLVGGDGQEPQLASIVAEAIKLETVVGDPMEGVATRGVVGTTTLGPSWTAAMGLAVAPALRSRSSARGAARRNAADDADAEAPSERERAA
jgi:type IV pilus assembly protein PilM